MLEFIEQAILLFFLALIWIVAPAYVIRKIWRRKYPPKHMKIEPVESGLPRVRHEPVTEIDAEYGRDYRGPGRKGEPFIAPGGWLVLAGLLGSGLAYWLAAVVLRPYTNSLSDWIGSFF